MQAIRAYALCGAVIAAVATWAFLQFPGLLIWCAFIGWAGFLHSGGERHTIKPFVSCAVFGAVMAWTFSAIITSGLIPLPLPVAAAALVAVIAPLIIAASHLAVLSIVPASFYGFACTFAFLAQSPGKFSWESLTSPLIGHVLLVVPTSLVIGVALGRLQTVLAQGLIRTNSSSALASIAEHMGPN